jgi:hypothetical protein
LLRGWLLPIQYQYQPLGAPVPIEVLRYLELTGFVQNVKVKST